MKTDLTGIISAVNYYLAEGWRVDHYPEDVNTDYFIFSPSGTVFSSEELRDNLCALCDHQAHYDFTQEYNINSCDPSKELLEEELNAENLLKLILLEPKLQYRNLGN